MSRLRIFRIERIPGFLTAGIIVVLVLLFVPLALSVSAAAPGSENICNGINVAGGDCGGSDGALDGAIQLAVSILATIAGIIGVIMLIIAGIKYITSQGDSGQIKSAKNTLLYAVIGLVVAAAAQSIAFFVLSKASTSGDPVYNTPQSTSSDGSDLINDGTNMGTPPGIEDGGTFAP